MLIILCILQTPLTIGNLAFVVTHLRASTSTKVRKLSEKTGTFVAKGDIKKSCIKR